MKTYTYIFTVVYYVNPSESLETKEKDVFIEADNGTEARLLLSQEVDNIIHYRVKNVYGDE